MSIALRRRAAGFTLIEAALTTVIVGTGVLSIVAAQQAYHQKNDWAQRTATGMLLANEIRELTLPLPRHDPISGATNLGPESNEGSDVTKWDDLDDFAGGITVYLTQDVSKRPIFSPPINSLRQPIADLPGWRQEVFVSAVHPEDVDDDGSVPIALDAPDTLIRMTVNVYYDSPHEQDMLVASLTWLVARPLNGY